MPKTLPAEREYFYSAIPSTTESPEGQPLVIRELESVNSSPQTLRDYLPWMSAGTWQWLADYFTSNGEKPDPQALAEKARSLEQEIEAARRQQTQRERAHSRACARTGMALAAVGAAAAVGMLTWGLARREGNALAPASTNDLAADNFLPQPWVAAAPVTDYRQSAVSGWRDTTLPALLNATRNDLVQRFPGIGAEAVAQLMVAPLLRLLDESLPKPLTAQAQALRQQQLALMINTLIPTLSIPEHLRLYQINLDGADNAEIAARFTARNGLAYITVDRQTLPLATRPDGTPFVIDSDGRYRFVRFNQKQNCWEFVSEADNDGYRPENLKLLDEYSLSRVDPAAIKAMAYNAELNVLEAKGRDAKHHRGVFARGKFIPTAWFPSQNTSPGKAPASKTAPPAACKEPTSVKLIAKSDYGWQVEPASVKMDEYLKIVLADKSRCSKNNPVRPLELIDPANGLSDDNVGNKFLKKDYRYYHVASAVNANRESWLTLSDYANASLSWKNGVMLLKQADNIVHALRNEKITNAQINADPYYIESDAVNYLREHAVTSTAKANYALFWRHPGLWQGKNGAMLVIEDKNYLVREYTDQEIYLKNSTAPNNSEQDIALWKAGDTLVRVRETPGSIPYTSIKAEKNQAAFKVETALHKQLQHHINTDLVSDIHPAAENLHKIDVYSLPVAWLDTQNWKKLFLYQGEYFPADFIDASHAENPSGLNSIRVYTKGDFYQANKPVATLVMERKAGTVEMKTWESYLTEKLNIKPEVVALYVKNYPWRHKANMRAVEEAVSEVRANGKHYVAPVAAAPVKTYKPLNLAAQRRLARDHLYPSSVKPNQLNLIKLSGAGKDINARKQQLQQSVTELTGMLKNGLFPALETALFYNSTGWPEIKTYLHNALGVDSDEFQSAFAAAWRQSLHKIDKRLSTNNIYLVHGKEVKLSDEERIAGPKAFMSPQDGNIYINTHKLNPDASEPIKLAADILQAVAYQQGMNCDVLYFGQVSGMNAPLRDAEALFIDRLKQRKLTPHQWSALKEASKRYLQHVPAYKHKINMLMFPEKLAYLTQFDPALRGHLFLNSAPFIALLSLDAFYQLAANNKVSADAAAWIKQYCALRNACTHPLTTASPQSTTSQTSTTPAAAIFPHLPGPRGKAINFPGQHSGDDDVPQTAEESDETVHHDTDDNSPEETDDSSVQESVEQPESSEEESDRHSDNSSPEISEEETDETSLEQTDESSQVSQETGDTSLEESDSHPAEELGENSDPSTPTEPRSSLPDSPSLPGLPVPPVPPAPPVPAAPGLPPLVRKIGLAAGGTALGGAGVGAGLGVSRSSGNETQTAQNTTHAPDTHPHKKGDTFLRHPQITLKNPRGRYNTAPGDDVFLPEQEILAGAHPNPPQPPARGRHPLAIIFNGKQINDDVERVYVEGHGNVMRVEIPELSCLGEKELTVSQMLRLIGEALISPVVANAIALQEIYSMEIKGGNCPSPEDVYWLAERASVFDAIINTVLGLVPPFWSVFALKNLLGPTLVMIADALEGKKISVGDVISLVLNAVMQAFSLFRTEVPMLNGAQRVKFYSKPDSSLSTTAKASFPFANRFAIKQDGSAYIKIKEKEYLLETTDEITPIVKDDQGRYRPVKFNQQANRWDMFFKTEKDNEPPSLRQRYAMPLTDLPREATAENGARDSVIIKIPNENTLTGVFIGMDFIPARLENVDGQTVAMTTRESVANEEQRLLVWSPYGWEFERLSVRMDSNLEVLLAGKGDTAIDISQSRFGAIRDADGLTYDHLGRAYIKKNNLYYKVHKDSFGRITIPDYEYAKIRFANGYFSLESCDDMLFTLKTRPAENKGIPFKIEAAALDYLNKYAVKVTSPEGHQESSIFTVNNDHFVVTSRTNNEPHITPKPQYGTTPIKLWSDNGVWFRIRDEERYESPTDYINLNLCRTARSPGGGSSCLASRISIDTELNQQLQRAIRQDLTSDTLPASGKLTSVNDNDVPNLYKDKKTNRQFFNFAGNYFNAKVIAQTNREENPTGYPCVKLTGRSDFFSREKEIATVVVIKDGDAVKLVDMGAFLAEKLNITPQQAELFLKNRAFIEMEHADEVESLTSQARLSESIYVEKPIDIPAVSLPAPADYELQALAYNALFPESILTSPNYTIDIHDLGGMMVRYSPTVQQAKMYVSGQLDYLKNTLLVSIIKSLSPQDYNNPIVEDYLAEIFGSKEPAFLNEVQLSLYSRLLGAKDQLQASKIKLLTATETKGGKPAKYTITSTSPVYIGKGNSDTIFINIDNFGLEGQSKSSTLQELQSALLNAVLIAGGKTSDVIDIPLRDGTFINIKDAYNHLHSALKAGKTTNTQTRNMQAVIERYLNKTPVYKARKDILNDMPKNWLKFSYLLHNDPGFRAHVSLNSNDLLTLIAGDLHYRIAVYHQDVFILHPWVKNYGDRRGVTTFFSGEENYTDDLTPVNREVSALTKFHFSGEDIIEVPGQRNIYSARDDSRYFKWQGDYYPVRFLGKEGRIIQVGQPSEVRQIYYYDPAAGDISVIPNPVAYACTMTYHKDLELFERSSVQAGYTEVFRFDAQTNALVSTGATKIAHMPGNVARIEFPQFTIYHSQGATPDIYLQGHGKTSSAEIKIPANVEVQYYADYGHQLVPYKGSADDILSGRFKAKEIRKPGEVTEDYAITLFTGLPENSYHLARKYNKNIIHLTSPTIDSTTLLNSISHLFAEKKTNLHLYMCRKIERASLTPANPSASGSAAEDFIHYDAGLAISRWAFDQEDLPGTSQGQQGFAPLRSQVYMRPNTANVLINHSMLSIFKEHPYETWYGFETDERAKMQIPAYIYQSRIQLRDAMTRVKTKLGNALIKLNDDTLQTKIDDYISLAFDTLDPNIKREVKERLKLCATRIKGYIEEGADIDYKNVVIASTIRSENPQVPGEYPTKLANDADSVMAYVYSGDALRRMFIIDDFFPRIKASTTNPAAVERTQEHIIIHESSHAAAETVDVFYTLRMDFSEMDVQGGLRNFNNLLDNGQVKGTPMWKQTLPAIYKHLNMQPLEEVEAIEFIKSHPMVKANIMIENADSVTRFLLDIAKMENEARVRRQDNKDADDLDYKVLALCYYASSVHHE